MKPLWLCIFAAAALATQSPATEAVLDIVGYRLTSETSSSRGDTGRGVGRSGATPGAPLVSLAVELLDLQRSIFNIGDSVIYEVVLRNNGRHPVTLPWSPDGVRFKGVMPQLRAIIALEIRDAAGKEVLARLEPQLLYGSKQISDSLLLLPPGQRARIRVPAVLRSNEREMEVILSQPTGLVQVGAVFQMSQQDLRSPTTPVTVVPK